MVEEWRGWTGCYIKRGKAPTARPEEVIYTTFFTGVHRGRGKEFINPPPRKFDNV